MGRRNYLIEGVSGTGKTTVCTELERRGFQAIHGDRVLAYQGDPETGEPTEGRVHENHIWPVERVKALIADRDPDEYRHTDDELQVVLRMHRTREDTPDGITIDCSPPVEQVVDDILERCRI